MTAPVPLLLLEDDPNLGLIIEESLVREGFAVERHLDGKAGLAALAGRRFALCLVDVMMPEMDGFSFAAELRRRGDDTPFIFLTARTMVKDRIHGFKLGCDDYITKPFSMEELLLRIQAVLRRSEGVEAPPAAPEGPTPLGRYVFDPKALTLTLDGEEKRLTEREGALLAMLVAYGEDVLERDVALRAIWQDDSYHAGRSMDVFISKLRKHLAGDPRLEIRSVHGRGFRLLVHDDAGTA
jgi:DNA-binding response OmpR family regulator